MIYLDTISAQRPFASAISAMTSYFEKSFGTPLQPHHLGQELFESMHTSYRTIFDYLGMKDSDTFVFTSSGQEAISQVMHSVFREIVQKTGKNHFIASGISEASCVLSLSRYEEDGCVLTMCPVSSNGTLSRTLIEEVLTPRTALITLPLTVALTGVVQQLTDLQDIATLCQERDIALHVDISQAIGKQHLLFDTLNAHFITFDGELIGAPRGTGGLFARNTSVIPLISGEDEQNRLRGGNLNVALLTSLREAFCETKAKELFFCTEIARLRDLLETTIMNLIPEAKVLFYNEERLPHISCIAFPGVRNELLLYRLNKKKLYASMGGGRFQQIEIVLDACKIEHTLSQCALTFSLSHDTTHEEITKAAHIIHETYTSLRKLSLELV